jgi:hypothetical protein
VNLLIVSASDLLARTLGSEIKIARTLTAELWPVLIDSSQLELALLNLATTPATTGSGALLGGEKWFECARPYLLAHPPRHPHLIRDTAHLYGHSRAAYPRRRGAQRALLRDAGLSTSLPRRFSNTLRSSQKYSIPLINGW